MAHCDKIRRYVAKCFFSVRCWGAYIHTGSEECSVIRQLQQRRAMTLRVCTSMYSPLACFPPGATQLYAPSNDSRSQCTTANTAVGTPLTRHSTDAHNVRYTFSKATTSTACLNTGLKSFNGTTRTAKQGAACTDGSKGLSFFRSTTAFSFYCQMFWRKAF